MNRGVLAAILLLAGCSISGAGLEETAPQAAVVRYSLQCGSSPREPGARWLRNRQQLAQALRQMQGTPPGTAPEIPDMDLQRWNLLLIFAGRKPSAGYRLTLGRPALLADGRSARLNVVLEQPAPDSMVAAVLTHPCMLVKIPAGDYHTIEIRGLGKTQQLHLR